MFAVGHAAYGYILAKATAKPAKTDISIPLVIALSLAPDFDLLIRGLIHRGASHSVIVATVFSAPFLLIYRAKALPYFVAIVQHSLVGDYLTGGAQLLYPLTTHMIGLDWSVNGSEDLLLEWMGFTLLLLILLRSRDYPKLLKPNKTNLFLIIPAAATLVSFYPRRYYVVPWGLLVPSLGLLALCALSILSLPVQAIRHVVPKVEPSPSNPGDKVGH